MIEAICAAFLLAGAWMAVPWKGGRYLHYVFSFVAFEAYLAIGPHAVWLVLGAGTAGALLHTIVAPRGSRPPPVARSLGAITVATMAGMAVTHATVVARGLTYPIPFSTMDSVVAFTGVLCCLFATSTLIKTLLVRVTAPAAEPHPTAGTEPGPRDYWLGVVTVGPLHYVAHPLFVRGLIPGWVGALAWSLLLNTVLRRELERDADARVMLRELARREHLSAVGELTARIVHQTRHQLGLIGISAHRIAKRIGTLTGEDARVVREELDKLDEVQRELSEMLTRDLRDAADRSGNLALTYATLIALVARRLEAVAETRGVRLELGPLESLDAACPVNSENVSHALFNVVENALTAARRVVRVEASARPGALVISVTDDGPGLTPAAIGRATEPFFTTKANGTGMGLAIARAAVEEEGAELRIANRAEGGCHVQISIPDRAAQS